MIQSGHPDRGMLFVYGVSVNQRGDSIGLGHCVIHIMRFRPGGLEGGTSGWGVGSRG